MMQTDIGNTCNQAYNSMGRLVTSQVNRREGAVRKRSPIGYQESTEKSTENPVMQEGIRTQRKGRLELKGREWWWPGCKSS